MATTADFDLEAEAASAPPMSSRPPRSRLVVFILIAVGLVVGAGAATFAVDQMTRVSVPDVTGSTSAAAAAALADAGLSVDRTASVRDEFCVSSLHEPWCVVASQSPAAGERLHTSSQVALVIEPTEVAVPDVTGVGFFRAAAVLEAAGLVASLREPSLAEIDGHGSWAVVAQSLSALETARAGTNVELALDRPSVPVGDVVGMPLTEAAASLEALAINVSFEPRLSTDETGEPIEPPAAWVVTGALPALGGELPVGSTVALEWGVRVPNLVGMTGDAAEDALSAVGLDVEFAEGSPSDTAVVAQQWAADAIVDPGSIVGLTTARASVVFEVVANGGSATITWTTPVALEQKRATGAKLPWRMTFSTGTTPDVYARGAITATAVGGTSITCSIFVNGAKVASDTATGKNATATCQ
jgi:beta-lactam-binding protein with PASTA domain